ncbi:fas apoptotic inhibitory molecule 1 isoform X1 [Pseudopipra pipra]|uniref:fas apoptotic inhibitory molecule 1 isoform X1 n=1 Tax=Pseudopipra pipra TaxID=415032 RepID=UPI00313940DE
MARAADRDAEQERSRYSHLEKMTDLVAVWEVALSDGVHKIEFEHGTTSGKRVVYVDGKEEIRREWMFKLVGKETFTVGATKTKAAINIDAVSGFAYEYTLEINGKSLKKHMENRLKTTNTWILNLDGTDYRVVLEKDTMDVWCNGQKMETAWHTDCSALPETTQPCLAKSVIGNYLTAAGAKNTQSKIHNWYSIQGSLSASCCRRHPKYFTFYCHFSISLCGTYWLYGTTGQEDAFSVFVY